MFAKANPKYVLFGALGLLAVGAAVAVAVILGTGSSPPTVPGIGPVALTASELEADLNQLVYWVGPRKGDMYELTRQTNNWVFVRYLPRGVKAGTHQRQYLTIATYPFKGALASLKAADNGHPLPVAGSKGAIAVVEKGRPTNVRVAYPGVNFQVEIYDPNAREALTLATSGALVPVP